MTRVSMPGWPAAAAGGKTNGRNAITGRARGIYPGGEKRRTCEIRPKPPLDFRATRPGLTANFWEVARAA